MIKKGINTIIGDANIGSNVEFGHNCIIEDGVTIGNNVYIDSNTIIRTGTTIGDDGFIGSNCIIGEYQNEFIFERKKTSSLTIGKNCLIRSGTIIYSGSTIGDDFQTGHNVTIREKAVIQEHVSVGTLSDIQGHCQIGPYVRMHSNVHVGMSSVIDGFNWIYPYVCLTNDPTPPSEIEKGVHIHKFAIVATGSVIMPGIDIASDSLVAACANVTKDVHEFEVVGGNPAKVFSDVRKVINRESGEPNYPWRYRFNRAMPWAEEGFEKWIEKLTDEEKEHYGLV